MAVNQVTSQKTLEKIIEDSSKSTNNRKVGELGKDEFINLLVTQLRYQDPLKPVEDKEFISQMAQFSALEQMQNMNGSLSQSQAFSLIGKHVTASVTDEKTKESRPVEGDVTSVKVTKGKVFVVVKGEDVPVEKVTDVTEGYGSSARNLSAHTGLIGKDARGIVYDPETSDIIGVNGYISALQKGVNEDYAVMDGVKVEISGVVTSTPSTNPNFLKDYLSEHMDPKDNNVTLMAVDRKNDQKVPVSGKLKDYTIGTDGKITVTLDQVNVPVDSISRITPPAE